MEVVQWQSNFGAQMVQLMALAIQVYVPDQRHGFPLITYQVLESDILIHIEMK